MINRRILLGLAIAGLVSPSLGCTHIQLRKNTVRQAATVSDIYQQQVLDNLAKFASDPNAMPHFAIATGGINDVDDSINGGFNLRWNFTRFIGADTGGTGTRTMSENWSLTTVSDPRKLELMRCAYQNAVSGCRGVSVDCCPDCQKRINSFYTGDKNTPPKHPLDPESSGEVTAACLNTGWFCVACESCGDKVRRNNPCCHVGTHCGCTVYVTPGRGTDELAKLTLAILDFAIHDPPPKKTKEVVAYLDANGAPANKHTATFAVKANVSASGDVQAILSDAERNAFAIEVQRRDAAAKLEDANKYKQLYDSAEEIKSSSNSDNFNMELDRKINRMKEVLTFQPQLFQGAVQGQIEAVDRGPRSNSILQTPAEQLFQLERDLVE